jgi:hypothetical protein
LRRIRDAAQSPLHAGTNSSPEIANPLFELIVPAFFRGDIEQSILHMALGVQGLWQLIPLLLIWLALGFLLLRIIARENASRVASA